MSAVDSVDDFFTTIDALFEERPELFDIVAGSVLIHIVDGPTRTIVGAGKRKGVFHEATDDAIDCALVCDRASLLALMDEENEDDVESMTLTIEGDGAVLRRVLSLL